MTLLSATGVQSETRLSFAGLHQLLRPVRKRVAELPEVHRDALDAAFGLTHKPAPERFRVAMATLDLLAEVAGERPLLLVVDDAHWLDPPTADVLAFVARRIESDPIVLLAATRDGYPSSTLTSAGLPTATGGPGRGDGGFVARCRRAGPPAADARARAARGRRQPAGAARAAGHEPHRRRAVGPAAQ